MTESLHQIARDKAAYAIAVLLEDQVQIKHIILALRDACYEKGCEAEFLPTCDRSAWSQTAGSLTIAATSCPLEVIQ